MGVQLQQHGLGFSHGNIIECGNGLIEYHQGGKMLGRPAFRVNVADITGFSVRKPTKQDKEQLGAKWGQEILVVQGGGTELASCAVNQGTAQKFEAWVRSHPAFGGNPAPYEPAETLYEPAETQYEPAEAPYAAEARYEPAQVPPAPPASVADELAKLAKLRDGGVLSPEEFDAAKANLLG